MKTLSNIIRTDSYKTSHFKQYPAGTTEIYSYMESRGGDFPATVFFGLQYYLKDYLSNPITEADIDYAEEFINAHMGPGCFNRAGWERIVKVHGGFFPVEICAPEEGTVIPVHNVLMTIRNTDPELPWVTNYVETMLLKIWYPITVATLSYNFKKRISEYLELTGDPSLVDFKLHDFGYRGVSSEESAALGGMAHLINFKGTDTMIALEAARQYYGEPMAGFSIPAAEHSTITSWGETYEYEAYQNMIRQFGQGGLYAVVSDSYDIMNAVNNLWGTQLKQQVLDNPATLVVRPDSGDPTRVVTEVVTALGDKFGYTTNAKGYKVLNKVRVIQGDGIDLSEAVSIMDSLRFHGWSTDNIAFGMGGALLQKINRDTQKFAIKASSMTKNNRVYDVFKNPVGDPSKASKRGKLKLTWANGEFNTTDIHQPGNNLLRPVFRNGVILEETTLQAVRDKVNG